MVWGERVSKERPAWVTATLRRSRANGSAPNSRSRAMVCCENAGPEMCTRSAADWEHGHLGPHFIPPGEPWRNGYVESFNSRIRDECLNINSFWSLAQARVVISDWKHDYNHHRRHSALGYQPPGRYAATCIHRCASNATSRITR